VPQDKQRFIEHRPHQMEYRLLTPVAAPITATASACAGLHSTHLPEVDDCLVLRCEAPIVACVGLQLLEVQVGQPAQQQLQLLVPQQPAAWLE
jgi:hypothetical protein